MSIDIDLAIVIVFLVINLLAGLYSGRVITTIKEYAIGNRNFSMATLSATLIATWIRVFLSLVYHKLIKMAYFI